MDEETKPRCQSRARYTYGGSDAPWDEGYVPITEATEAADVAAFGWLGLDRMVSRSPDITNMNNL